jgi:alkanesulfonate monooxygenase SsuD/methylene tetrahydromethanopterin reductase-like flavin-dependent oxidoreductase (luciferase family)
VPTIEVHLFLPQMRMSLDVLVDRARAAEAAGFTGIALMDHLAPPGAPDQPMYEAMTTATWIAAHTSTLTVGHLVLCDAFREPAVLAKQAVTLDHASGGRFELGIGWGSVPDEIAAHGLGPTAARPRVDRLAESLAVLRGLWSGEPLTFAGEHHRLADARQLPTPLTRIPLVIGGIGPRTLDLVAQHADWWNCPIYGLDRIDELRRRVGAARVSVQQMATLLPADVDDAARAATLATVQRRFGWMMGSAATHVAGTPDELAAHLRGLRDRGVERVYAWTTDFAAPESLARWAEVVAAVG